MGRQSQWGFRLLAAFLVTVGFSTLARLLIEALKHNEDLRSDGTKANGTAS